MPITKSAKKTLRKDRRRTLENKLIRNRLARALSLYKKKPTLKTYSSISSLLDRSAKKGTIHQNKASRLKSRLIKLLKTVKKRKT